MDIERAKREYLAGSSLAKIAEWAGKSPATIKYHLNKAGVAMRSNKENSRRYSVNHQYFTFVDSEDKAYWLGFMFADGHVSSSQGKRAFLTLGAKDKEHIEKFRQSIVTDAPIGIYHSETPYGPVDYVRLTVCSDTIYDDLVRHGCVERKSNILSPPEGLRTDLVRHFIRGYNDGDGSVYASSIKMVGTKSFIEWVASKLPGAVSVRQDKRRDFTWCLDAGYQSLEWLYRDSVTRMERKYGRAVFRD